MLTHLSKSWMISINQKYVNTAHYGSAGFQVQYITLKCKQIGKVHARFQTLTFHNRDQGCCVTWQSKLSTLEKASVKMK